MIKMFYILRLLVERGMAAEAQLTFQGLRASHTDSETAVARLTFQGIGAGLVPNWIREILFGFKKA